MEWVYLFFGIALCSSMLVAVGLIIYEGYKKRKSKDIDSKDR